MCLCFYTAVRRFKKMLRVRNYRPSLTILVLIVSVAAIIGTSYLVSWRVGRSAEQSEQAAAGERLQQLAYQMSDKADRGLDERVRGVYLITHSVSLTNPATALATKQLIVSNIGRTYPEYSFVGITDTKGILTVSKDGLLMGVDVSQRPWFKEAIAAKKGEIITQDVHEALLLAKLLPPSASGEPLRFIDIAGPLFDSSGTLLGVVGVHLSFDWIDGIRQDLIQPNEQRDKVEVTLLSADNKVLLGPGGDAESGRLALTASDGAMPGMGGYTIERWPDGIDYLTGYFGSQGFGDYKGLGWKVLVRQPVSIAFAQPAAQAESLRSTGLLLGVLSSLIISLLLWQILKREKELKAAQTSFISLASHQLRTPATAVKQQLGMIIDGYASTTEDIRSFVQAAYKSNESQLDIIEDLLSVAHIDSGKLAIEKEPSDIGDIITSVVREQLPSKKESQEIKWNPPQTPVIAHVDGTKIAMCIGNLLSNAIKYTPEAGEIHVDLAADEQTVTIKVTDTGYGISKEDQNKLFKKFGRVENPLRAKIKGTGLGLYLVKKIMMLHKGRVWVESEDGKGAAFILQLPKE